MVRGSEVPFDITYKGILKINQEKYLLNIIYSNENQSESL